MKNYGLIETLQEVKAYVMGNGGKMPYVPYNPKKDYTMVSIPAEYQSIPTFDTYNCTGFTITSQIEKFMKFVYGLEVNYSDRWVAIISGTLHKRGNDPQDVYEAIRTYGLIPESMLPFDANIDTPEEYFSFKGANKEACYREGRRWLERHTLMHEWLWPQWNRPSNYMEIIHDSLETSPIAFTMSAFSKEGDVYVSSGDTNNHITLGVRFDGGNLLAEDSYKPHSKKLSATHNIKRAKRIWIERKTKPSMGKHIKLLQSIVKLLMNKRALVDVCTAYLGRDVTPKDKTPDEVACAETATTILRELYPHVPLEVSTIRLDAWLSNPENGFIRVLDPRPGDIIISPTESPTRVGHIGFVMEDMLIASNTSFGPNAGKFLKNHTISTWKNTYQIKLSLEMHYYRVV